MMLADIGAKSLQLLKEAIPQITRVAVLWNPDTPFHPETIEELKAVALSLSIDLKFVQARTREQFGPAFSVVRRAHAQALYVLADGLFTTHRTELVQLTVKEWLPTIYWAREFAKEGGLMSYGPNYADLYRRAVGYVDKIFRGAKAGDLPIEQPEKLNWLSTSKPRGPLESPFQNRFCCAPVRLSGEGDAQPARESDSQAAGFGPLLVSRLRASRWAA
jgi:putative tryptophan/tyrosine transport system substrate-binding protein